MKYLKSALVGLAAVFVVFVILPILAAIVSIVIFVAKQRSMALLALELPLIGHIGSHNLLLTGSPCLLSSELLLYGNFASLQRGCAEKLFA